MQLRCTRKIDISMSSISTSLHCSRTANALIATKFIHFVIHTESAIHWIIKHLHSQFIPLDFIISIIYPASEVKFNSNCHFYVGLLFCLWSTSAVIHLSIEWIFFFRRIVHNDRHLPRWQMTFCVMKTFRNEEQYIHNIWCVHECEYEQPATNVFSSSSLSLIFD